MKINKRNLKAFVRYDGSGRAVPSGPLLSKDKPDVGDWKEIRAHMCCTSSTTTSTSTTIDDGPYLRLVFTDLQDVINDTNDYTSITDVTNVDDWNDFFFLNGESPLGDPFTSVAVEGNEVRLYGGGNMMLDNQIFQDDTFLITIDDGSGVIIELGVGAFQNSVVEQFSLPAVITANDYAFEGCSHVEQLYLPLLQTAGNYCFRYLAGSMIDVTFPSLETVGEHCFSNLPNGIQEINLPSLVAVSVLCFSTRFVERFILPSVTSADEGSFTDAFISVTDLEKTYEIYMPLCTALGSRPLDDGVFDGIAANNEDISVVITVNNVLATNNDGGPDGDLTSLPSNVDVVYYSAP